MYDMVLMFACFLAAHSCSRGRAVFSLPSPLPGGIPVLLMRSARSLALIR